MSNNINPVRLRPRDRVVRKTIGVGIHAFDSWSHLAYRLKSPHRGRIGRFDHVTVPCQDLQVAEDFYVGLLRARIALRLDPPKLQRIGWSPQAIADNHAAHLQLTFARGPRLDLFEYPAGVPAAPMHPHIALSVPPRHLLGWKQRLVSHGIKVAGPTRPGPPGQASFYFNDPFGNHLELVTIGFVAHDLPVGVPDRSHLDYQWHPTTSQDAWTGRARG